MGDIEKWLKSGEYLPRPLRDFHDQKDTFKAIHQTVKVQGIRGEEPVDWVSGHCYVIDVFLWYMARRGYTLQRTCRKGEYRDLDADVQACKDERDRFGILTLAGQAQGAGTP
jgi:hypothetical protein